MLSIYTTEDIISAIYKDGEDKYTAWYDLITKTRPILKVLLGENTDYDTDEYNPVFMLEKDYDINVEPEYKEDVGENSYLARVANMQLQAISDPFAVFILDVDEQTAKQISDKYGVICHSFDEPPISSPLFQESIEKNVNESEKTDGWRELINNDKIGPSNSLVIIDRYLFSPDGEGITSQDAFDNVYNILNNLLPKSLEVDYHVLIIFDATKLKEGDSFEDIATKLCKKISKLQRNYKITIEVVSISKSRKVPNYKETHNRRIFSNYFIIRVEHSLKAFRKTKSLYTQSLWLDWVASKGVVRQRGSDCPVKSLSKLIDIRDIINQLKEFPEDALFYQADIQTTNETDSHTDLPSNEISRIVNRLVQTSKAFV